MTDREKLEREAAEYNRREEARRLYILRQCWFLMGTRRSAPDYESCPMRPPKFRRTIDSEP